MIVSVPVLALGDEPVTGASTNAWPASRQRSSSARAVPGRDRRHVDEQRVLAGALERLADHVLDLRRRRRPS